MAAEDRFADLTREHREIWGGFTAFLKIGTASCIAILVLMAVFLA